MMRLQYIAVADVAGICYFYSMEYLSRCLNKSQHDTYNMLKDSGVLFGYIVPLYDVLHTFSREYIIQDLTSLLKEKGVL